MKPIQENHPVNIQGVSVIGLGKLGMPLAVCLASKGFRAIGVDVDNNRLELINKGIPPVFEPGLKELMQSCSGKLSATGDYEEAIQNSEVTFILVPTPSDGQGAFSLRYVIPACE